MAIEKALLLKGLGVCALCAGGTTVAFKWKDINSAFSSSSRKKEKISVAGLECEEPTGQEGGECSIKTGEEGGKILVKKESSGSHFEVTTFGEGKIKVYKVEKTEGDQGYKKGFKFLIEDGDITGSGGETNKLEEFESYEVKEWSQGDAEELKGKQYFSRKTDSKTEIKNALGLHWDLPTGDSGEHQNITNENVGAIKFSGGTATLSNGSVTLKITKETNKTEYPLGYKFTFKNTNTTEDATLAIGSEAIKIKNVSPIDYDFKIKRNGSSLSLEKAWSIEDLAKKVGLAKESTDDYWDVGEGGLNIKQDTTTLAGKTKKPESKGKIKVSEGQTEYNGGFKFTIEEGDLILNNTPSTITLGQFQSYEIVKEGDKLYLSKKDDGQERIKELLGIKCEVPTNQTECSLTPQNIKTIKFKGGTASLSGGNVTLAITKDTTGNDYPLGFKFSFKNTNDSDATLTINKEVITLKKESPVEFKIKKEESSLTLEKAWTLETLASKVGLVKQNDGYWFVGDSGMNVKLDGVKKEKKEKYGSPHGRIKVYSDQKGYNEGFKFTVEKGDLDLKKEATGTQTINLGQFQSFEIVKDTGVWYLSRKEGDQSKIKNDLGLPCDLPTDSKNPTTCDISEEKIKTIKFEGAGQETASITGSPKLTIAKEDYRSLYPLGYKFTFTADSGSTITIPSSSGSLTLRKGLSIDYKIKNSGTNKDVLTLEKAWTADTLIEQADFKKNGSNDWWSLGGGSASIKQGNNKSNNVTQSGENNAKIRVYEGTPGYNQGYKFVVEEGDTTLDGSGSISKLSKYESYEVTTHEGQWYFTRKLNTSESIREILGLPSTCSMPTDKDTSKTCSLSVNELNEVKFKDKSDTGSVSVTSGTSVTLKITKESDTNTYPLGYKFSFDSLGETTFTIPQTNGNIEVKNGSNTEFKIKEAGGKSTLEKKS